MTNWQDYMVERIANREPGIPWFIHDKLKCYRWCEEHGLATVTVLRDWANPGEISLAGLPSEYVIKPSMQSSTKGVMVIRKVDGELWDSMQRRYVTEDEIVSLQEKMFDETQSLSKRIIVEAKIEDVAGVDIPRDFKAYSFGGEIALILEIDRNTKPSSVSWFDGEFNAVTDDRVTSNPEFTRQREAIRPKQWAEILDLAKRTSAFLDTPFASIDMYSTQTGPIVGEVTLAPGGLYHGKHYTLSAEQQDRMGAMWARAAEAMNPDTERGRLNILAKLMHDAPYALLAEDQQHQVDQARQFELQQPV